MPQKANPGAAPTATGAVDAQSGRTTHVKHSDETPLAKALRLAASCIPVFPCNRDKKPLTSRGFKDASCDPETIERWWFSSPTALIGVPTGQASGLWAADADVDKQTGELVGDATLADFGLAEHPHRCSTRSGGTHYLFRWARALPRNSAKKIPGVDVRGEGGYVIAWDPDRLLDAVRDPNLPLPPPALLASLSAAKHPNGSQKRASGTANRVDALLAQSVLSAELEKVRSAREGSRRDTLNRSAFRIGQILSAADLLEANAERELISAAMSTGLDEAETILTVRNGISDGQKNPRGLTGSRPQSAYGSAPDIRAGDKRSSNWTADPPPAPTRSGPDRGPITEDAVALEFTRRQRRKCRYVHDLGKWMLFSKGRWKSDEVGTVFELIRTLAREMAHSVSAKKRVGKKSFVSGAEQLARNDAAVSCRASDFNKDPYLLGTPAGVIDLRTGTMRPATPEDMISLGTAVGPSDEADCPLFKKFLEETTNGDWEMMRFLQQFVGYCLTGIISEHALVFIYGPGGNGKSLFLAVLKEISGDYADTLPIDALVASNFERHPTYLAKLVNARLVTASETERGKPWAEAQIKQLTGGDQIAARLMRQDYFTFDPKFKLVIVGNHEPVLQNVDDALRRRFNIVPFTRKPKNPDKDLLRKLQAEYPAILRWMIDGAEDWVENGLIRPNAVIKATDEYFERQDLLGQWLDDRCEVTLGDRDKWCLHEYLYADWSAYTKAAGEEAGSGKAFTIALRQRGFVPGKGTAGKRIIRYLTLKRSSNSNRGSRR